MLDEVQKREAIITEAMSWLNTPYHTGARVKGAGVDCLTLVAEVYARAGLIEPVAIPYYPNDWHLHRESEKYLNGLLTYTKEIASPQRGDIALWKFGRCYSHGAIVITWPIIIHAYLDRACVMEDASKALWLSHIGEGRDSQKLRPVKFFSVF